MDCDTPTMAMVTIMDRKAVAVDVATKLGMTTTTLYTYVNGDGTRKAAGGRSLTVCDANDAPKGRPSERLRGRRSFG